VDVNPRAEGRGAQLRLTLLAGSAEPLTELGVAGVDGELLAGLCILDDDDSRLG
jgi:hypothetical protein